MQESTTKTLRGAEIIAETLIEQGVTHVFGYPGGYIIDTFDALYLYRDKIKQILTSHGRVPRRRRLRESNGQGRRCDVYLRTGRDKPRYGHSNRKYGQRAARCHNGQRAHFVAWKRQLSRG